MYLKTERITVEVDGVKFTSYQTTKPQFVLDPTAISGWDDGVSIRRNSVERPTTWGDFTENGRMASRVVTLTGTAVSNTPRQLIEMRNTFTGILNNGGYKEMSVGDSFGTRYLSVGLEGTPTWLRQSDTVASWQITLYAPDPRILGGVNRFTLGDGARSEGGLKYRLTYPLNYGTPETVTVKVAKNAGNADAWPVFTVTGDFYKGFTISNGINKKVTFPGMVTAQAPVEIDMARGTATQHGVDKTILMTNRQWFSIPAESSIRPIFEPGQNGSAGWCDIIYRDTWI